eukprot:15522588-Heterocapsa_arctica.AAC.1
MRGNLANPEPQSVLKYTIRMPPNMSESDGEQNLEGRSEPCKLLSNQKDILPSMCIAEYKL